MTMTKNTGMCKLFEQPVNYLRIIFTVKEFVCGNITIVLTKWKVVHPWSMTVLYSFSSFWLLLWLLIGISSIEYRKFFFQKLANMWSQSQIEVYTVDKYSNRTHSRYSLVHVKPNWEPQCLVLFCNRNCMVVSMLFPQICQGRISKWHGLNKQARWHRSVANNMTWYCRSGNWIYGSIIGKK